MSNVDKVYKAMKRARELSSGIAHIANAEQLADALMVAIERSLTRMNEADRDTWLDAIIKELEK